MKSGIFPKKSLISKIRAFDFVRIVLLNYVIIVNNTLRCLLKLKNLSEKIGTLLVLKLGSWAVESKQLCVMHGFCLETT